MNRARLALVAFAVLLPTAAVGCSVGAESTGSSTQNVGTADWDRAVTRPASEASRLRRAHAAPLRAARSRPRRSGRRSRRQRDPDKNIVVLMQENRSFDAYFGHLNQYGNRTDIESAPDTSANPEKTNTTRARSTPGRTRRCCAWPTRTTSGAPAMQFNGGKMDGFFQTNQGYTEGPAPVYGVTITVNDQQVDPLTGDRALWWYDERDIPFYYDLANTFAIADHYHSSILGPTYPNRDYLYAASSYGVTSDDYPAMRKTRGGSEHPHLRRAPEARDHVGDLRRRLPAHPAHRGVPRPRRPRRLQFALAGRPHQGHGRLPEGREERDAPAGRLHRRQHHRGRQRQRRAPAGRHPDRPEVRQRPRP